MSYWPWAIVTIKNYNNKQTNKLTNKQLPICSHIDHSFLLHCIHWPTIFSRRKIKHIFSHAIHYMYAPSPIPGMALPAQITPEYSFRQPYLLASYNENRPLHEFTTIQSLRLLQLSAYSSSLHFIPASIQEGNSFLTA